jgi:hypothetical protein
MAVSTSKLDSGVPVARRLSRRSAGQVVALLALTTFLASSSTRAYGQEPLPVANAGALPADALVPASAEPAALVPVAPTMPPPANPALDLRPPAPEQPSIFGRWWFWTAVGAAAAATVVLIVVSSRGHAPPATDLGNQEFQP